VPQLPAAIAALQDESIHILREVLGEFERPALLFSGGKDSAVLLRLLEKAVAPARIPIPVLHIDTGHNFPEVLAFRDRRCEELGVDLLVGSVQATLDAGRASEHPGAGRNALQATTLLETIAEHRFDALIGGARRDEEKARAKERIFSLRGPSGEWDPRNQRPELWSHYNPRLAPGEQMRVFPLSNWTEMDVWRFIVADGLQLPPLYYAHEREVAERDGMLIAVTPHTPLLPGERSRRRSVRYRTVGDATCTGAVASQARTPHEVLAEVGASRLTERGATRADDRTSDSSMEERKRRGYF
jgi:sulfate adenylyltransferase subunit 2